MVDVDWTRIAKPQDDGYDADIYARFDADAFGWHKYPVPRLLWRKVLLASEVPEPSQ